MVRFKEPKNNLSQENEAKTGRTIFHYQSTGTGYLQLQLPVTWQIHDVFYAALLRPYKENGIYGENFVKPPPELEEGEEVYDMETILNHRKRG